MQDLSHDSTHICGTGSMMEGKFVKLCELQIQNCYINITGLELRIPWLFYSENIPQVFESTRMSRIAYPNV